MEEVVVLEVSAEAAEWVGADSPRQRRLLAARGEAPVAPGDLGALFYYLSHDHDPEVRSCAITSLQVLAGDLLLAVVEAPETHQRVLEILAYLHAGEPAITARIACHPSASQATLAMLVSHGCPEAEDALAALDELRALESTEVPGELDEGEAEESPDEEADDEQFRSKYQLSQTMGVAEKVKMALTGDKEWRSILIKDANKMVSGAVIKNPRITDGEILTIAKSTVQNDEIMRAICTNKEWVKSPQVRKALAENNKTPLPFALRFLSSLSEKDLASLAKSKSVSSVIANQARRQLLTKKKH